MPRRARERLTLIGVTTAVTVLMTSSFAGAHGGDASAVHACVEPASGSLRIVGPGSACKKNETPLDWTKAGTIYSAGSGLALSADNEFSVTDVPWSDISDVPEGFADNDDDDGSILVEALSGDLNTLRTGLSANDGIANEASDPLSFSKINDLVESIFGVYIADGTITADDLATDSVGADELADNSVHSLEVGDGAIRTHHLAVGAVTTIRVSANASRGIGGPLVLTDGTSASAASAVIEIPSGDINHSVLLTGQAVLSCTDCQASGVPATVRYAIVDGDTTLSDVMTITLDSADSSIVLPVSSLDLADFGTHTYELVITATGLGAGNAVVTSPSLQAIDLGRSS